MTASGRIEVYEGGVLSDTEIVALTAALTALLDHEAASAAADPIPTAYRSAWRSEAIRDALDAGTVR